MDRSEDSPIWKPQRETRIDLPELCFMHGGPVGMRLLEHEHREIQLEMHYASHATTRRRVFESSRRYQKVIPSGKPHVGRWEDGSEVVVVLLGKEYTNRAADDLLQKGPGSLIETGYAIDPVFDALGVILRREFLRGGTQDRVFLEAIGVLLSGHLLRQWMFNPGSKPARGQLTAKQLGVITTAIEEQRHLSIASLAHQIGLGPHQFTRLFRRTMGQTPYQYIVQRRLLKACSLLEETAISLTEIALKTGFANQSHFTSLFTKSFGSSPLRYRLDRQRKSGR